MQQQAGTRKIQKRPFSSGQPRSLLNNHGCLLFPFAHQKIIATTETEQVIRSRH
jgi:hypothetical protein